MLIRLAFHFIASAPASGCLAGDVRPEHQHLAAAGVGHLVKNRGEQEMAASTLPSQRRLPLLLHQRFLCLRLIFYFLPLFFSLIWIVANFQCKPPGVLHLPGFSVVLLFVITNNPLNFQIGK